MNLRGVGSLALNDGGTARCLSSHLPLKAGSRYLNVVFRLLFLVVFARPTDTGEARQMLAFLLDPR